MPMVKVSAVLAINSREHKDVYEVAQIARLSCNLNIKIYYIICCLNEDARVLGVALSLVVVGDLCDRSYVLRF